MVSGSRKNALGYPPGFVLESHGHANPLLKKADFRRAGFIEHALWVTAFDAIWVISKASPGISMQSAC